MTDGPRDKLVIRLTLPIALAVLATADVAGGFMLVAAIQGAVERGSPGWWAVTALFAVLWSAALILTWPLARRVWQIVAGER